MNSCQGHNPGAKMKALMTPGRLLRDQLVRYDGKEHDATSRDPMG